MSYGFDFEKFKNQNPDILRDLFSDESDYEYADEFDYVFGGEYDDLDGQSEFDI